MNVPGYLKISDLLRQNEVKEKGKGKANAADLATVLLKHANKVQEEWKNNLSNFKEILQKSRSIQNEFRDDELLEDEYGSDLIYNNLPSTYYYDDYSDSDSGTHDEDLDFDRDKNVSYDKEWLLGQCRLHIASFCDADGAITPEKLCTSIFTILRSDMGDDDIQTELVDLIGFDNLNFVTTLVTKRLTILENIICKSLLVESPPDSQKHSSITIIKPKDKNPVNERIPKHSWRDQKKTAKQKSTEEEDLNSANILGFSADKLRAIREHALRTATDNPLRPKSSTPSENYKHVFGNAQTGSVLSVFGNTYSLPVGTKREDFEDHEEIIIPITRRALQMENEKLIHLNETDNLCRGSFKYKTLNRVQSLVYPVAYKKNENLLICAPTGAGKTDIAILTILRTIKSYSFPEPLVQQEPQEFIIYRDDFKIVYIAPMKALAAEIVKKLGDRLKWLDVQVRELTGDMQLTKSEISNTQIIVTTPEKWDVITRKSTGDVELSQKVRLLIIDEIHLLHEDRGAVLESLVARTRRQIESSQNMIRIVGLSATLPNYVDVARFLGVDLKNGAEGLFYFDGGFRPVPLEQHFIGVKGKPGSIISNNNLNMVCWKKVLDLIREKHQVMIFVHSRKDTVKTAKVLHEFASEDGCSDLFDVSTLEGYSLRKRDVTKSRNKELKELFEYGLGIHHAGMLRADRSMTERLFSEGFIKVLCCTATLAWGVNLPAYAVIIKGTQVYDSQKGRFDDLSILDVMQIFGRAGRPQYETHGVGYILTTNDKLSHYVSAMTQQHPIESKFVDKMVDNLNAEISLGTVTNVDEGVRWLGYTYLFVRMKKNPLVYGMNYSERENDPELGKQRRELIVNAAKTLHKIGMIKFYEETDYFEIQDIGRIASNYYITYKSMEIFNEKLKESMKEANILSIISQSSEFADLKSREEEAKELERLKENACPCQIKQTTDDTAGKVNILLQAYLSNANLEDFALISDSAYVIQNTSRIVRALFEIALNRNWAQVSSILLDLCKCIDKRMWTFENPLAQFKLPREIIMKLQNNSHIPSLEDMRDMSSADLGRLVRHNSMGTYISKCVDMFPMLKLEAQVAPITRNILRVTLSITPDFVWNDRIHGIVEPWWIFVEDSENVELYHSEYFILNRKQLGETQKIGFAIPIQELPPQLYIRVISDRWIGAEAFLPVSLNDLVLPKNYHQHTELLNLSPLPVTALKNKTLENICSKRFTHFNPVQTQVFETIYNSSTNVLVGAPTGSGKTVTAELAMWWAFREHPRSKVVYIAPLKALVRERVDDWQSRLTSPMKKRLVELTGDVTPDLRSIENADIIITTPEKWDGISRSWQHRSYVQAVSLVIIDEIHLLGGDRGPILEVIVSRMNYISSQTENKVRIVGLSTALANAQDLADWLCIDEGGLFNFRHSVRPVPLEIHIEGFSGRHYCPRMATMNKPTFINIMRHSPIKPVIVFVSSRRQTRLTAQDLIAYSCLTENPHHFLRMTEEELQINLSQIKDNSMKSTLTFGIGLHHAGLTESDRKIVELLFLQQKIQVLVATSTLAWGVNLPAHLVVIKGTEFYDAKTKGYVDFPITDVLQMMGRAGRPQFDDSGVACIFVQDSKKNFYKKFLYEPFPVESSLHMQLENHFNAEIVAGTIKSKEEAMKYLSYTYLYRRLQQNPAYYELKDAEFKTIDDYLSELFEKSMKELSLSYCIKMDDDFNVEPTSLGRLASYYYLSHKTIRLFRDHIKNDSTIRDILGILCNSDEYSELPVRHNEDLQNQDLEKELPWSVQSHHPYDSPHAKAFLLLQAHLIGTKLSIADYVTDTLSVLDQAIRILQSIIDITVENNMLTTCLHTMSLLQCIKQSCWPENSSLLNLPGIEDHMISSILHEGNVVACLGELLDLSGEELFKIFKNINGLSEPDVEKICKVVNNIPLMDVSFHKINHALTPKEERNFVVSLKRVKNFSGYDGKVYAPRFPKPQYESWWLVFGDKSNDSIIEMKRINMRNGPFGEFSNEHTSKLKLTAPEREGNYQHTIFLISDGYLGLDQQYDVEFQVKDVKVVKEMN